MTAPIERALKLLALATDAGAAEEEARTAAMAAARAIRAGRLVLLAPDDPRLSAVASFAWPPGWEEAVRRGAAEGVRQAEEAAAKPRRKPKPPKATPVVVEAMTPCARGPHGIDAGRRMWRIEGQPGLTCGLCHNGCP